MNGLAYATETALHAQRSGLRPSLAIFLSEGWADLVKQPAPAAWRGLPFEQKLAAVQAYSEQVVRHFAAAGLDIDTYEIGNEIDFGICGEFEPEWPHRVSLEYMRRKVWPRVAEVIKSAEAGVRRARPDAKFILHLAQWNNSAYCMAFWEAMLAAGVQLDFPGLSYYPSAVEDAEQRSFHYLREQVDTIFAALHKPVVICESGYPAAAQFPGQFAAWNHPAEGYQLTPGGQAKWVVDYVALVRGDEHFARAFYWSPEWYGDGLWDAFALFDHDGRARDPAVGSFRAAAANPPVAPSSDETLHTVPAPAAVKNLHVYFGNLHSHTADSDGNGTPEEVFTYARDVAKLDFLAVTDHNHLLGGEHATPQQRTALYAGPDPAAIIPAANRCTRDGRFVALYGQEFSSMSKGNHVNVFDVPAVIDVPNGKFDDLLHWVGLHPDTTGAPGVIQFNHPGLSFPPHTISRIEYGRDDFGDDAAWLAQMGRAASLIELLNGESRPDDPRHRSPQIMEDDYRQFLAAGFHLAPTGDQDNHHKQWGTSTDSRTAIFASALTKPALLAAMRARHVYASEDKHLRFMVTVDGHLCGDVLATPGPLEVALHIDDPDAPACRYTVEAIRGKVGDSKTEVARSVQINRNLPDGVFVALDGLSLTENGQFVYFRVIQTSEVGVNHAWTAPVWLESAK